MTDTPMVPMRGTIVGANFEPEGDPTQVHVIVSVDYREAQVRKEDVFIVPNRDGLVIVDTKSFIDTDDESLDLTRFAQYLAAMLPRGIAMTLKGPDADGTPTWTVSSG